MLSQQYMFSKLRSIARDDVSDRQLRYIVRSINNSNIQLNVNEVSQQEIDLTNTDDEDEVITQPNHRYNLRSRVGRNVKTEPVSNTIHNYWKSVNELKQDDEDYEHSDDEEVITQPNKQYNLRTNQESRQKLSQEDIDETNYTCCSRRPSSYSVINTLYNYWSPEKNINRNEDEEYIPNEEDNADVDFKEYKNITEPFPHHYNTRFRGLRM